MPEEFQFVGFSEDGDQGTTGILKLSSNCQKTFPGSRMCTTGEVARSVSFPAVTSSPGNPTGLGWVAPTAVAGRGANIGFDIITGIQNDAESLTCGGWGGTAVFGSTSADMGLAVSDRGQFRLNSCATAIKVACCAPVVSKPK